MSHAKLKKLHSSLSEEFPLFKRLSSHHSHPRDLQVDQSSSSSSSTYLEQDMVERSCSFKLPGTETNDLRIALFERKEVVERLQEELNAEREASATSASEAMSMILRLQGEKAELAMEADQYKRMVEERMSHAEISFSLLEDFIYQKEIEITALEYQVEAYRSQLFSLGFSDLNSLDAKLQENDDQDDKMNLLSLSDRSQTPSPELVTDFSVPVEKEVIEQSLDSQRNSLDVYWDQIKKLDEQVKELTEFRDSMRDQCRTSLSGTGLNKGEEDFASSSNFQEHTQRKEEAKDLYKNDETLMIKVSKQKKMEKKLSKQTRDRTGKRNRAEYQAELQRLRQRVELLERGRIKTDPETSGMIKQEEISVVEEELSPLQSSEEKSLTKLENLQTWIDPAIVSVQEAMLYFWL